MGRSAELRLGSLGAALCLGLSACQSIVGLDDLEFAVASGSYQEVVMSDDPVAYFRFEETAPTKAANEVPGGVEGTYVGKVELEQPGALGDAGGFGALFDAAMVEAARIELGNNFGFDGGVSFSFEVWVSSRPPPDASDYFARILSKRLMGAGYDLELNPGKELLFQLGDGADVDLVRVTPLPFEPTQDAPVYQHVVVTYGAGTLILYLNGEKVESATGGTVKLPTTPAEFFVATQVEEDVPPFGGWLDELAIYDKALSPDRVAEHYAAAGR